MGLGAVSLGSPVSVLGTLLCWAGFRHLGQSYLMTDFWPCLLTLEPSPVYGGIPFYLPSSVVALPSPCYVIFSSRVGGIWFFSNYPSLLEPSTEPCT